MSWRIRKPTGAILLPFTRIGGNITFPPPLLAHVQTDGSYGRKGARVAAIILSAGHKHGWRDLATIKAHSSTETEWASVAFGLQLAIKNSQEAIGLENDNLSVIQGLLFPKNPLRHEYANHYRNEIQQLAAKTVWTGVRWIPRERNKADDLFHLR